MTPKIDYTHTHTNTSLFPFHPSFCQVQEEKEGNYTALKTEDGKILRLVVSWELGYEGCAKQRNKARGDSVNLNHDEDHVLAAVNLCS